MAPGVSTSSPVVACVLTLGALVGPVIAETGLAQAEGLQHPAHPGEVTALTEIGTATGKPVHRPPGIACIGAREVGIGEVAACRRDGGGKRLRSGGHVLERDMEHAAGIAGIGGIAFALAGLHS